MMCPSRILSVIAGMGVVAGLAFAGGVTSSTTKNPSSLSKSLKIKPIGATVVLRGPLAAGTFASCTSKVFTPKPPSGLLGLAFNLFVSDSFSYSASSEAVADLTHQEMGHSHWASLATAVVGYTYTKGSTGNKMSSKFVGSNTINYTIVKEVDGIVTVPMSGYWVTSAYLYGPNGSHAEKKFLYKPFVTLSNFWMGTSIKTEVLSTNSVSATYKAGGLVTGQIANIVFAKSLY